MKCPNCGKSEFRKAKLFDTCILEGYQTELYQAYACINCGRIEMYMPEDWGTKILAAEREAEEKRKRAEEQKREEQRLRDRMAELEAILQNENYTLKELKEAQRELTAIQDKLHIHIRRTYFKI